MKGYLFVKPVAAIGEELNRALRQDYDDGKGFPSSLEGAGWIPLQSAIKQGNTLKVSAETHGTRYEAYINLGDPASTGGCGTCEVRGGPLACKGVIRNVSTLDPKYHGVKVLYVCESSSGDGRSILKWWIGVNEFVDADQLSADD